MTNIIYDIETTALELDDLANRIISIATKNLVTGETKCFCDIDESKILKDFWDYMNTIDNPTLIGYNSDEFDLPVLVRRSLIRRQRIKKCRNLDLRKTVNSFFTSYKKFQKGNLAYWADVLGIPVSTLPGSEMCKLFIDGKYEEIKAHNLEDVKITEELYKLCEACNVL